jgi:Flp pilus assembly protein TadD
MASHGLAELANMATIHDALAIGQKLLEARDLPRALQVYNKIVEINPQIAHAWFSLGVIHQLADKIDESVMNYEQALRIEPGHPEALNNLGVALHAQGKTSEAVACLRRVLAKRPDHASAHGNLGNALQELGQLDEAVACYRQALNFDPTDFDAHNNLGNALRAQGHLAESVHSYEQALKSKPDHPQVRLSQALCWLQMGDFERGWAAYEWRLKCPEFSIPAFRQPLWDGAHLDGRTILLYADHGLGDSIQFIRYAPMVKTRGGHVIVACQQPVARLFSTCPGIDLLVASDSALPDFDVYAPLMSLPRIFGTNLAHLPADVPYLKADPAQVEQRRCELEPNRGFRVGIAWQGNPRYRRDRQRSFRLAQLEPLAGVAGAQFFSLQKGAGADQIAELGGRFVVTDLGNRFSDLMDTAAAIQNLDLVITSDSSLAHLAGALGVPIWVAIPLAADWRWLTERDDNPWYPTMRLFRQKTWGDWDEVFARMAASVAAKISGQ